MNYNTIMLFFVLAILGYVSSDTVQLRHDLNDILTRKIAVYAECKPR